MPDKPTPCACLASPAPVFTWRGNCPYHLADMKFLVTGGAGFIGSHLCERLLLGGHSVWAFDDLNSFYNPDLKRANLRQLQALAKPFEFVFGDLTDLSA